MNTANILLNGTLCCLTLTSVAQQKPNILLIVSDDMGYSDIGCYGGLIGTPNLDRLADQGLQYMQFYNTARSCPSRASLLTGLHPHQAGIGHMTNDRGEEGYRGDLNRHCVTIAQALKSAGYENYALGKWHVTRYMKQDSPKHNWPIQRGFDHFYGTISGGGSYYDPFSLCRGNKFVTPENDEEYTPQDTFYYTDALGDNAVLFLNEHKRQQEEKPFFMYVAFTAAHWPMQVPEKYVEPYKGKFDKGWDRLREEKYEQMVKAGIIRKKWKLSYDNTVTPWDSVENKEFEIRCMEVYAGMVACMDENIGKMLDALEKNGQLENTLILFLQDNGGCAEDFGRRKIPFQVKVPEGKKLEPMDKDELQTVLVPYRTRDGRPVYQGMGIMPGGADVFVGYGKGWAYLSDAPFKEYKHWIHEGGIATPLIVHWPAGIPVKGEKRWIPGQLPDIMATCVEVSSAVYPKVYEGEEIYPCEGRSLVPSFQTDRPDDSRYLFWEHEGNRAVRSGKWKLVHKARGNERDIELEDWELYDMEKDRTEIHDLARKYPRIVRELSGEWEKFAERCQVKPWPRPRKN